MYSIIYKIRKLNIQLLSSTFYKVNRQCAHASNLIFPNNRIALCARMALDLGSRIAMVNVYSAS